ncbi:MAG: hypothetical protein HOL13_07480 [Phycisphaerae bacterium]|jgi:hypothetical protein|nr:hypothetical protein [Phycisphaerae bacterium]
MPSRRRSWRGPVLPLALAALFGVCWLTQFSIRSATASFADRSEYLSVAAGSGRGEEEVLWMFDTRTEELIVVAWDRQAGMMVPLGRREVFNDIKVAGRSR